MRQTHRTGLALLQFILLSLYICQAQPPNILVIIADDIGVDVTHGYQQSAIMPATPNIDALRANGLTFKNAWSAPTCTPTRAAIMSGKYGVKNGVLGTPGHLSTVHNSVFKELETRMNGSYASALIGKWHIASASNSDFSHPAQHGINHYEGFYEGQVPSYYNWMKVTNGVSSNETEYVTTHFTNSATNWINAQTQPWFLWLAHVAPHAPFETPPDSMYTRNSVNSNRQKFMAMIEALDFDIGRLLANIPPTVLDNTTIIFIGDNGSPQGVNQNFPPHSHKGTLYQGGVHVPMIVSGAGVNRPNEEEHGLVHVTDIYATILEIAGADLPGGLHNSLSFEHLLAGPGTSRPYNYTEVDEGPNTGFTIRNAQYKLIEFINGSQEFYDLYADSLETTNLINSLTPVQQIIKTELREEAEIIRNNWSCQDLIQNGTETAIDDCMPVTCTDANATSTTNIGCCETPAFPNVYTETAGNDIRYINTNNFPDHDYCFNPNRVPMPIVFQFQVDQTPVLATNSTSILSASFRPDRYFGVGLNGVMLAPAPATPFIFENPTTGEYNWNWVYEPTNNQGSGMDKVDLDCASAHTNGNGVYHYHGNMFEFAEQFQTGISTTATPPTAPIQIGWASDGFPILYRFGPDGSGGLALLQPSFQVKGGDRPGDGISAPCGPYNGKYTNDYTYLPASGDLDECNGISRPVTLTTAQGEETFNYFYVVTDSFPQISRCMKGIPDESFNNSNNGSPASILLAAKAILEGPYEAGKMNADLKSTGTFPTSSPYLDLGYEAATGQETIDPSVLNVTGPMAVVDWVLVELRHEVDPGAVLYARSGLILKNGNIVDVDGVSALNFNYTPPGNYYVAIHHRNHLSIRTQDAISLSDGAANVLDFTLVTTAVFGSDSRKDENGVYQLWAGDATNDDAIDAADRSASWNYRNTSGYLLADLNMDGTCDAADRSVAWNNRNKVIQF